MSDIFKLILEGTKRTRPQKATDDKLNSILNNQESHNYSKSKDKKTSNLFAELESVSVGEERDSTDHLAEMKKLSMKELDKLNPKEQLKILKLEYNRVYDKLSTLNKKSVDSERTISDLQMEQRTSFEEVRQMRNLLRLIVYCLPGNPELKERIDKGSWKTKEIEQDILSVMQAIVERIRKSEDILEQQKEAAQKEMTKLKEMILAYKQNFSKAEELMKEQHVKIQSLKSQIAEGPKLNQLSQEAPQPIREQELPIEPKQSQNTEHIVKPNIVEKPTPSPTPSENIKPNNPIKETIKPSNKPEIPERKTEQKVATHKPHFSDFFNDFKSAVEKEKQSNKEKTDTKPHTQKKDEPVNTPKLDNIEDPFEVPVSDFPSDPFEQVSVTEEANFNFDPFSVINPSSEPATQEKEHPLSPDYVEPEREEIGDVFDTTIDAYLQNISLQQEYLLKVIGNTGISRNSDLKEYLKNDEQGQSFYFIGKKYNANALNKDVSDLRDKGILSSEQINYGGKGSGFIVYELSKIGKSCFKVLTDENPVVAEKKRIVGTHASLEHGYLIKDSAKLFAEMGYKVYTDLDDVSIKIDERHRKVFDFIAENEEGKLLHIEVERGTHTQEDFSYAMDKIYEITKEFYFICPNESVKNKNTKKKFFTWVTKSLGGIQKSDVILNMTTIEQLKKKSKNIWETTDLRNVK